MKNDAISYYICRDHQTMMGRLTCWLSVLVVTVALTISVFFGSCFYQEMQIYLSRSEENALLAATDMFTRVCSEQSFDPESFKGPQRPPESAAFDARTGGYTFEWKRQSGGSIYINIKYLPYDIFYTLSDD